MPSPSGGIIKLFIDMRANENAARTWNGLFPDYVPPEPKKGKKKCIMIFCATVLLMAGIATAAIVYQNSGNDNEMPQTPVELVRRLLTRMPVIDGHNDFPWNVRAFVHNDLSKLNFTDLTKTDPWAGHPNSHTDLTRLKAGQVGAQFFVAYTSCGSQYKDSVIQTMEQIDIIRRLAQEYSKDLQFATSADDIENAIKAGKIAALVGVEGGHSIQSSFGILRTLYDQGTRYMTLTHSCNTPWADSSPVDDPEPTILPQNGGLSEFGLKVVAEMNRIGMMIDISHVSVATMKAALTHSKAPVIFSHSSAFALCNHHRNVPDDVLRLTKEKNSLVMVNFYNHFIRCDGGNATLLDVAKHIDYIRNITGPDHVGIGGDYDGVEATPIGLEDVSKYPDLFLELYQTGRWTEEDLEKLSGRNLLRVFRDVEKVRDSIPANQIQQETITRQDLLDRKVNLTCITSKFLDDKVDDESGSFDRRKRAVPSEEF